MRSVSSQKSSRNSIRRASNCEEIRPSTSRSLLSSQPALSSHSEILRRSQTRTNKDLVANGSFKLSTTESSPPLRTYLETLPGLYIRTVPALYYLFRARETPHKLSRHLFL